MPIDVKNKLLKEEYSKDEFEVFLGDYFGNSSQIKENQIIYGEKLIVEYYGKNNKKYDNAEIKLIFLVDERNKTLLAEIEEKVEDALSIDNGLEIGRVGFFSPFRTKGIYRADNDFQIIPPPKNAKVPRFVMAEHNPFVVEFSYYKSLNDLVNSHRKNERSRELCLMLNVFLYGGVRQIGGNTRHEWVFLCENDISSECVTEYAQISYILPNDTSKKDEFGFSTFEGYLSLKKPPQDIYYSGRGVDSDHELSLPDNFELLLSKYNCLPKKEKSNFLRASYWKKISRDTFHISKSNSYLALVSSIESMIPPEMPVSNCDKCKREIKKGLTQLFHDFVETYCPGIDSSIRKELYSIRSKYTHGKKLMLRDLGKDYVFNSAKNNEITKYRAMSDIVRISLINWLLIK